VGIYFLVWISAAVLRIIVWKKLRKIDDPEVSSLRGFAQTRYLWSGSYKTLPDAKLVNLCKWQKRLFATMISLMILIALWIVGNGIVMANYHKG
jgi:hypothetical protein